jgi:hypothetical protein
MVGILQNGHTFAYPLMSGGIDETDFVERSDLYADIRRVVTESQEAFPDAPPLHSLLVTDKGPRLAASAATSGIVAARAPLAHGSFLTATSGLMTCFLGCYRFDSEAAVRRVRLHGLITASFP